MGGEYNVLIVLDGQLFLAHSSLLKLGIMSALG
jgi:hypothetical protein